MHIHFIAFHSVNVIVHTVPAFEASRKWTKIRQKFENNIEADRIFQAENRTKSSSEIKKSEEKEKERCLKEEI